MAVQMGIGKIGLTNNILFKRKFRWLFEVNNICGLGKGVPPDYVKVAARPNVSFEETEVNFLHGKMKIPGKATFENITVTYYDVAPVKSDTILYLYDWIGSVYDFLSTPGTGNNFAGSSSNPRMSTVARGAGGYAAEALLTMLDGSGEPIERWTLENCWPQSVNFGDLDYSSSEESTIELTLAYMFAKWTNLCNAQQPAPCYNGCAR
jgi:hypothetical protein